MTDLEITLAQPHEREVLENLMQLYVHDFSEQWSDQPRGEVGGDGRFEPYPLDPYWSDASHVPLLLRRGGHIAGFALLDAHSHAGRTVDRNMAEFFILRKHRRGGVGLAAAHAIFARYPGVWEAAVARRNIGALHFWRRAAAPYADVEETDVASDDWNGPVLRFRV
ncbi:acetyltransferase [Phenylobacterium sp. 20VBR1]|uniref:Acetyltransferase n=1 Tax=Phenylobacterium glaciei TaxID=2803784 RepID=A0A941D6U0_9CAUL|nr:GNAT family N-acetyltransferase [Phenylobacterium glaciei]MBR7621203.1 acetyltransferase [Phenylobacterium glaciei]